MFENVKEGDRVTVTLTGEVVGKGSRFVSVKIDGNEVPEVGMFGQERLVYIYRENSEVSIEPTPQSDADGLRPGDLVRLTGTSWDNWDLRGRHARVKEIYYGEAEINDPEELGRYFAIYANEWHDYSAEKVED